MPKKQFVIGPHVSRKPGEEQKDIKMLGTWVLILFVTCFALLWGWQLLWRWGQQKSSAGHHVRKGTFGALGVGNLPLGLQLIAQIGNAGAGQETLDGRLLRPTPGLRLISIAFTLALLWLVWGNLGVFVPDDIFLTFPLTAFILYAAFYANLSYLRFDNDGFEIMNWRFQRQSGLWEDLIDVRDDGHYFYVFSFQRQGKMRVLKFLQGMPHFLSVAFVQIEHWKNVQALEEQSQGGPFV